VVALGATHAGGVLEVARGDVEVRYGWPCLTVALSLSLVPLSRLPAAPCGGVAGEALLVPVVLVLLPCPFFLNGD
jgi:hypothetical protein